MSTLLEPAVRSANIKRVNRRMLRASGEAPEDSVKPGSAFVAASTQRFPGTISRAPAIQALGSNISRALDESCRARSS